MRAYGSRPSDLFFDIVRKLEYTIDMQDGPHRSLSLNRYWKKAMMRADRPAFSVAEVTAAREQVLCADWKHGIAQPVLEDLRRALGVRNGSQIPLFQLGDPEEFCDDLRNSVVGLILLGHLQPKADCESISEAELTDAVCSTLSEWLYRHLAQIKEHYCRRRPDNRTQECLDRMIQAADQLNLRLLARHLLAGEPLPARVSTKLDGLDDGVRLP